MDPIPKITAYFSCEVCGLVDEPATARARLNPSEPVVDYVLNVVGRAVTEAHLKKSLLCPSRKMSQLKIPIDKDDPDGWVGKPLPPGKETLPPSTPRPADGPSPQETP